MKMPASFAEFSDALQKARIKDGSFCKNELTCIHYNGLTHAMIGWNANLYDLNLFAQRLASLTEEQKKGMDALLKIKQNHRVAPIPLNQLINLTYNTDICCFAPRVSNHEELGAFLYANEMLSNEAIVNPQNMQKEDFVKGGTATGPMLDFLAACLRYGVSVCVAGATGSGKTTVAGWLLTTIPDNKRIFTIENGSRELDLVREKDGRVCNSVIHTITRESENAKQNIDQDKGRHEAVNPISESLQKRFIDNGMPQEVLTQLVGKKSAPSKGKSGSSPAKAGQATPAPKTRSAQSKPPAKPETGKEGGESV